MDFIDLKVTLERVVNFKTVELLIHLHLPAALLLLDHTLA
jgi:hypothetical protein